MSAPAMNVLPPPMITMARAEGSFSAASKAATRPSGTPGLRAFTGGLLMVTTATPSCVVRFTRLFIGVVPLPWPLTGHSAALGKDASGSSPLLYCGGYPDERRARHTAQDAGIGERQFNVAAAHAGVFARHGFRSGALPVLDRLHQGVVMLVRNGEHLRGARQLGTCVYQRTGRSKRNRSYVVQRSAHNGTLGQRDDLGVESLVQIEIAGEGIDVELRDFVGVAIQP